MKKDLHSTCFACSQRRTMKMLHMLALVMRMEQKSRDRQNDDVWVKKQFLRDENDVCGRRRETDLCLTILSLVIMVIR
jgi:hypothetical protein